MIVAGSVKRIVSNDRHPDFKALVINKALPLPAVLTFLQFRPYGNHGVLTGTGRTKQGLAPAAQQPTPQDLTTGTPK